MTQKIRRKTNKLLPYQSEFVNDITTPHLATVCGLGAGKTKGTACKAIKMLQENPGCNGIGCEPTGPQLAIFKEEMDATCRELGIKFRYVGQGAGHPAFYTFDFGHGPQKLLLVSAENYKKSLVGHNAAFGFIDEADTIEDKEKGIAIWNALNDRCRDPKAKYIQTWVSSTPEGYHIVSEIFGEEISHDGLITKPRPGHRVWQIPTSANIFLPSGYVEGQLARYTEQQAQAKIYGRFVNVYGQRVYSSFERARNTHKYTLADFPNSILHIGMDFNIGNMHAVVCVIKDKIVYAIDEITKIDITDNMIAEIKRRYPNRAIFVYPDVNARKRSTSSSSASMSDLTKLQSNFECYLKGNNPDIRDRVDAVNALFWNSLNQARCFVNIEKCPVLVRGLEQQGYKNGKPDKTSGVDHCLDAFGYFIYYRYPIAGKGTITTHK